MYCQHFTSQRAYLENQQRPEFEVYDSISKYFFRGDQFQDKLFGERLSFLRAFEVRDCNETFRSLTSFFFTQELKSLVCHGLTDDMIISL